MTKSMLIFSAVLIVALGTQPVLAQEREFVGVTAASTKPDVGILVLHNLCATDFEGARMCSSIDIVRNGVRDGLPFPGASSWINPTGVSGSEVATYVDGASGVQTTLNGGLSCGGWRLDTTGQAGMVLSGALQTIAFTLCNNVIPVACCVERKVKSK